MISQQHNFQGQQLSKAIELTFNNRNTSLKQEITAFKQNFIDNKEQEWKAYIKTLNKESSPPLSQIIESLKTFLLPMIESLIDKNSIPKQWKAPGPWDI